LLPNKQEWLLTCKLQAAWTQTDHPLSSNSHNTRSTYSAYLPASTILCSMHSLGLI
jgi:hypothetical protein